MTPILNTALKTDCTEFLSITPGAIEEPRRAEKRDGAPVRGVAKTDFGITGRGDVLTAVR